MTWRAAWSPPRRPSRAARRSTGRDAPPVAGIDVVFSKIALSKAPSLSGPYPALMPQICASHLLPLTERRAPIAEDHTSGLQDVRPVGDVERHVRVLLDEEHGRTCGADLADDTEDLLDQQRCEAKRWLVEHKQSWPGHERSSMASICCSPPLRVPARCCSRSRRRGKYSNTRGGSWRTGPRSRRAYPPSNRFSCTVSSAKICRPSGTWTIPARTTRSGLHPSMRLPSKSTEPRVGRRRPDITRNVVVLPAPFAPSSATTLPSATSRLTLCRAQTRP